MVKEHDDPQTKHLVSHLSESQIIGDLISREKYTFANKAVIAEVVRDTMLIVKEVYQKEIE